MKVDLDDLRGFVAVAELGSFHAAADALHLSQPALTRRAPEARGDARRAADRPRQPAAAPELGRARLLLQGEAAARRAGRRRARHPRAGRSGVGRGDDRGGADRDLLFPAEGDRGLQHAVSAASASGSSTCRPTTCWRRSSAARPSSASTCWGRRSRISTSSRCCATRSCSSAATIIRWRASSRSAGRTSRPTASSRSAGSAATGSSWTRHWPG